MAKIDDYFQKLQNFLLRKLKITQKVSGMKYTGSLGVYEMELEAFRAIQVISGHPKASNLGMLGAINTISGNFGQFFIIKDIKKTHPNNSIEDAIFNH